MTSFRIKVCGITRLQDALLADRLGADLIGFVFDKNSPRFMTIRKAEKIIRKLPPTVDKVGVFIEPIFQQVMSTVKALGLDYAQVHQVRNNELVSILLKSGVGVIESFYVTKKQDYSTVCNSRAHIVQLDNRTVGAAGGTGKRFDWHIRPPRQIPNLMLAGGINSENVSKGVRIFRPLIIDVNSGVEISPGIKSSYKLKRFFKVCNRIRYGSTN
jgi:phosphoribosylanthranilate isomerase